MERYYHRCANIGVIALSKENSEWGFHIGSVEFLRRRRQNIAGICALGKSGRAPFCIGTDAFGEIIQVLRGKD